MFYAIKSDNNKRYRAARVQKFADLQEAGTYTWKIDPKSVPNWDEVYLKFGDETYNIKVSYRSAHLRTSSKGKIFHIAPHFVCFDKTKYGITSESKEHKLANNFLYNQIEKAYETGTCKISLIYCELNKPYKYNFKKNLLSLPLDFDKLDLEVTSKSENGKTKTRADIFIPFLYKDSLFGNGLNFEIQFSKQKDKKTLDRTYQRAITGKSTIWLFKDDFNIEGDYIELINNEVKCYTWAGALYEHKKNWGKDFKKFVEEQTGLITNNLEVLKDEHIKIKKENISFKTYVDDSEQNLKKMLDDFRELSFEINELDIRDKLDYQYDIFKQDLIKSLSSDKEDYINNIKAELNAMYQFYDKLMSIKKKDIEALNLAGTYCPKCVDKVPKGIFQKNSKFNALICSNYKKKAERTMYENQDISVCDGWYNL